MSIYAELLHHRELFANLFRRDFRVKYKGSVLGVLWSLVNPLVLMGIYTLVFSVLFPVSNVPHYPLYLLSGLAIWVFFSGALTASARSLVDNANLIKKVRFPRQIAAFSTVATQLVALAAILLVLVVVNFIVIPDARATVWLAFPLVVPVIALTVGLALAVSAVNVLFRDVEHIVSALLLPWFFLTPIMYSFDAGGPLRGPIEHHHTLVEILRYGNFITPPIEAVRDVLFWGRLPRAVDVVYLCVAAVLALALGAFVFRRVDDRIAVEL
ncbi:MAG: ABC transporter permease [Actinobacteria bacterium]|nr:ABC transporter permease [Actinomycetota bacterium]